MNREYEHEQHISTLKHLVYVAISETAEIPYFIYQTNALWLRHYLAGGVYDRGAQSL